MPLPRAVAALVLVAACALAGAPSPAVAEPAPLHPGAPLPAALALGPPVRPAPARGSWPLRPRPTVVDGFDPPATRWGAGHRGVDLAGTVGQQVHSALAGTVTFAGRLAGRGVVVVDHGGTRTTYEPVSASVRVGDRVAAGAVIGRLELFGSHCLPRACLHWGLIEGRDHYLDPLTLVGAAPVVLLPMTAAVGAGPPGAPIPLGASAGPSARVP